VLQKKKMPSQKRSGIAKDRRGKVYRNKINKSKKKKKEETFDDGESLTHPELIQNQIKLHSGKNDDPKVESQEFIPKKLKKILKFDEKTYIKKMSKLKKKSKKKRLK
jgi:hypothetical protein